MSNPFTTPDGAARYAAGQPDVQPLLLSRVRPFLKGTALGIDVTCGTGQCSVALAELVDEVLAFDVSREMLARARRRPRVKYALAAAEALPVPDHYADVLTVCMGFHWFERSAFLSEARRVLKPDGVLAVLDSHFEGRMEGRPDFAAVITEYYRRLPSPTHDSRPFGEAEARTAGFSFQAERLTHTVPFDRPALIAYLLSQSNALTVLDTGIRSAEELSAMLDTGLAPFLPSSQVGESMFEGVVRLLTPLP